MNYYISTFKNIKPKKLHYNILKKRINTINILNNNKFIDTLNETDIEYEQNDLIPTRAIKIFNNEKKMKKFKYLIDMSNALNIKKRPKSSKIKLKPKDSNYIIKKYQNFLNKESKNLLQNYNENLINNNNNLINNNLINNNNNKNEEEEFFFHLQSHKISNSNNYKNFFNETTSENSKNLNSINSTIERSNYKNKTISNLNHSKKLLLTSTNFSYSPKNKKNFFTFKDKKFKQFFLEHLNEIKKEKKLFKLKTEINNFEKNLNSNTNEEIEIKKKKIIYNDEKFIRTGFENKKKGKIFLIESKIKNYINQPNSNRPEIHKKKFKLFDQIIIDSEINNITKNNFKTKNKKKIHENNENWNEKLEKELQNEIIKYQHNLGEFIFDENFQGVHQKTIKNVNYGERQFKEAIFESKRENDINLDKTIKEKSKNKKKLFLEAAFKNMNLQKKNTRKIHIKYSNKY